MWNIRSNIKRTTGLQYLFFSVDLHFKNTPGYIRDLRMIMMVQCANTAFFKLHFYHHHLFIKCNDGALYPFIELYRVAICCCNKRLLPAFFHIANIQQASMKFNWLAGGHLSTLDIHSVKFAGWGFIYNCMRRSGITACLISPSSCSAHCTNARRFVWVSLSSPLSTAQSVNHPIHFTTDILIAGAGPAGASTSIFLSREKIPHIIIDKASFPRDKVCGDAISGKSIWILNKISAEWQSSFCTTDQSLVTQGIQFIAPDNTRLIIPFSNHHNHEVKPIGFVSRRVDFDNTLAGFIDSNYATMLTGAALEHIEEVPDGLLVTILLQGEQKIIFTKMIVGAEGRSSLVAKKLAAHSMDPAHYSAGIRAYYQNVGGMHAENHIELHFLKELQPGYLWIFPLPNGAANVGVGMLSKAISAKKVNLKQMMLHLIATHPSLKHRFTNAVMEGEITGWGLPLGSTKRQLSGNRFILTGDAGSLIDPFTGEGIGNALVSGLVAARVIKKATEHNDFSAALLQQYDRDLYKKLWAELRLSRYLQLLCSKPRLFNFVIGKASRSRELKETISCMFGNVDIRKKFMNPFFYLKILLNK